MDYFIKKSKVEPKPAAEFIQNPLPDGKSSITSCASIPREIRMAPADFDRVWKLHPNEFQEVMMFGNVVKTPRWSESFGESYHFSGMDHKAQPIEDPYLVTLLDWVRKHSGKEYNQILVNCYQDGNHYIGPHSDDENQLVPGSSIYSFSFGQKRDFVVTSKKGKVEPPFKQSFPMGDNSLLIMEGDMQKNFKHQVPKRSVTNVPGPRINITFRLFKK